LREKSGSSWMEGFDLRKSPPLWKIMRQGRGTLEAAERVP
jgi:hypothetical protein